VSLQRLPCSIYKDHISSYSYHQSFVWISKYINESLLEESQQQMVMVLTIVMPTPNQMQRGSTLHNHTIAYGQQHWIMHLRKLQTKKKWKNIKKIHHAYTHGTQKEKRNRFQEEHHTTYQNGYPLENY
jgi:hypothetical protein